MVNVYGKILDKRAEGSNYQTIKVPKDGCAQAVYSPMNTRCRKLDFYITADPNKKYQNSQLVDKLKSRTPLSIGSKTNANC